ncbi:metallophosphoesterase [Chloroherpeton thalassium ATCC 35110]|uniref:Metallophosphoesterase n=1 Tax=Chloroherpeton thalassium (strain ATCC 35110 / GB-78) TaxID=517418 RepID=B3QT20_CHLT3|nr:metallophosphoesterase [Chloroherpeton thalassium]ACF12663.1 metallophosphoesterase [Chloroherpeton thalassium ATCC 35110]
MKIAHISDIHIDHVALPNRSEQFENLIINIFEEGFDHLIITGDVTDVAREEDMLLVKDIFERNGLLDWKKITLIPGNHDLFGKYEFNAERVLSNAIRASGTNSLKKLQIFCEIFRDVMTPNNTARYYFPFVKIFNGPGEGVAIVAFNSVFEFSLANNPIGSRGYIRTEELRAMLDPEVLDVLKGKFVIALCHHAYKILESAIAPYEQAFVWTMELINRSEYVDTLRKIHAKVALHGHLHKTETYEVDGITFMNAGAFKRDQTLVNSLKIHEDGGFSQKFLKFYSTVAV